MTCARVMRGISSIAKDDAPAVASSPSAAAPMPPRPTTPSRLPRRVVPTLCCQPPPTIRAPSVAICRARAMIRPQVSSAGASGEPVLLRLLGNDEAYHWVQASGNKLVIDGATKAALADTVVSISSNGRATGLQTRQVTDSKGRVLSQATPPALGESMRVVDARNTFVMNSLLQEVTRSVVYSLGLSGLSA